MKLLKMKCITDPYAELKTTPRSILGDVHCMVKLETMFERVMYDIACEYEDETFKAFDNAMYCELNIHDDEVVYYFNVDGKEREPAVGETFELEGIKYERIA